MPARKSSRSSPAPQEAEKGKNFPALCMVVPSLPAMLSQILLCSSAYVAACSVYVSEAYMCIYTSYKCHVLCSTSRTLCSGCIEQSTFVHILAWQSKCAALTDGKRLWLS